MSTAAGGPVGNGWFGRRRNAIWTISVLVVVVTIGIAIAFAALSRDSVRTGAGGPSGSPAPSPSAEPSTSASPSVSTVPKESARFDPDPVFGDPVTERVELDDLGMFDDGVTARITDVTTFEATGSGVGEVSGPAVRFTIDVANGSSTALALDDVSVNLYSGDDVEPAFPYVSDVSIVALTGTLPPGGTASGAYSFGLPPGSDPTFTITVSSRAGDPIVVFGP